MRHLFIFAVLILIPYFGFTQSTTRKRSINMGFHQMNSAGLLACYVYKYDGFPTQQSKATFMDLNFLVSKRSAGSVSIKGKSFDLSRLALIHGFGINNKGFVQKGMTTDGSSDYYEYTALMKRSYVSLYGGFSYDFISYKKLKAGLGILLNPDIDLGKVFEKESNFRLIGLGSRCFAFIEYEITKESGLRFSPYFQSAVTNYYKSSKNSSAAEYRPYGFGFNIGLLF